MLFQGVLPAFATQFVVLNRVAGGQITDSLVPVINQHARGHHGAAHVIQPHATVGIAGHNPVDEHHAGDLLHKSGKFLITQSF